MNPSVTIRDVARRARVAVSTASAALNNKPFVSEKTRQRVIRVAEELDYHPHSVARNLACGRTKNLGLINPIPIETVFSSGFFLELIKGMHDAAFKRNYKLSLHIVNSEEEAVVLIRSIVKGRNADGLVITNPTVEAPYIRELKRQFFPFVLIGRPPENDEEISYVDSDNIMVSYVASKHLIELGHRRIALVTGPDKFTFCIDRLRGYKLALEEAGIKYDEELVWECNLSEEDTYGVVSRALKRKIKFSALFAISEVQAVGAVKAIKDKGLDIPADIAVVGVDLNLTHFQPAITTVDLHAYDLGYLATKLLVENITSKDSKKTKILVPADLIVK
jgi:DNA-binding LacI/PurR family transcriptional regulator